MKGIKLFAVGLGALMLQGCVDGGGNIRPISVMPAGEYKWRENASVARNVILAADAPLAKDQTIPEHAEDALDKTGALRGVFSGVMSTWSASEDWSSWTRPGQLTNAGAVGFGVMKWLASGSQDGNRQSDRLHFVAYVPIHEGITADEEEAAIAKVVDETATAIKAYDEKNPQFYIESEGYERSMTGSMEYVLEVRHVRWGGRRPWGVDLSAKKSAYATKENVPYLLQSLGEKFLVVHVEQTSRKFFTDAAIEEHLPSHIALFAPNGLNHYRNSKGVKLDNRHTALAPRVYIRGIPHYFVVKKS